jgi:hypothetical protein
VISLKQFLEIGNYRVTEGSEYWWDCFGPNAYTIDVQVGKWDTPSASIIFDRVTQEVYQASVHDYQNSRAYRLFCNQTYKQAHDDEAVRKNVNGREAWDDVDYTDLEMEEDFLEKMTAIMDGKPYDTKIAVPLDLDNDTLFKMMKMAHERDITFNQLVETCLRQAIAERTHD